MKSFLPENFVYTPDSGRDPAEPIVAILYTLQRGYWRASVVQTTEDGYGFDHTLDGAVRYQGGCGQDWDKTTGHLSLPVYVYPPGCPPEKHKLWVHPTLVKGLTYKGQKISQKEARKLGFALIQRPLQDEPPFDEGSHTDYEVKPEWCAICHGHYTIEGLCCHLRWEDGGGDFSLGCGAPEVDLTAAQTSLYHLLEVLPPEVVSLMHKQLKDGSFELSGASEWYYLKRCTLESPKMPDPTISLALDHLLEEPKAEETYWPGIAWLSSLDRTPRCQEPWSLTLGWVWQWQKERHSNACVLNERTLYFKVSEEMLDEWLARPVNNPKALEGWTLIIPHAHLKEQGMTRDARLFLETPHLTRKVYLVSPSHRSIILRVEGTGTGTRKRGTWVSFSRVLSHNGQHPSTFDDYQLVDPEWLAWWRERLTHPSPSRKKK